MIRKLDAADLRAQLRAALVERLAPGGWSLVEPWGDHGPALAEFVRSLNADFAATVEVWSSASIPDEPPIEITPVGVGVAYEPLRRLAPLFGARVRLTLIGIDARWIDDDDTEDELEVDDAEGDDDWSIVVNGPGDVAAAADEIASVVGDTAIRFAERYDTVDVLLRELGADDPEAMSLKAPAVLAAAGRIDEARAALDAYPFELEWDDDRRLVFQLRRFIDSGGDVTLVPSTPPSSGRRFERDGAAELWKHARAAKEAVEVVRRDAAGDDRAAQRALLETELAGREVTESPLWIEGTLDQLRDPPKGGWLAAAKGLGKLGLAAGKLLRDGVPDMTPPPWLALPDGVISVDASRDWAAVTIEPAAADWLARAHAEVPRLGASAVLQVWLDDASAGAGGLAVHLGERRVGTVEPEQADRYADVMREFAARGERPAFTARLTPRPAGHLLEIALPDR